MVSLVRQDLVRFIGGVLNVEGGGLGGGANVTGGGVGNNSFGGGPRHVSPLSRANSTDSQGGYLRKSCESLVQLTKEIMRYIFSFLACFV